MDSNEYSGGRGWAVGAWNPQQGYPQQAQQPQLSAPVQNNSQPAPQLFCCEHCQRVAVPAAQTIHAYTTRLAFFVQHVLHPTIATYAQTPNRQLNHAFFDILPLSTVIPSNGGYGAHTQGANAQQGQQHQGEQYQGFPQQVIQQQVPAEPMNANAHYTAVMGNFHNNYQGGHNNQGFGQQGSYRVGGYPQHGFNQQRQHAAHNGPHKNQPPQQVIGPIMYGGSSYGINPSIPIPLPNFVRPTFQLNVKFRLERYRLDAPATSFPYGNAAISPYQSPSPFNSPYHSNTISVNTNAPRARENMELIWYFWPVQLEIPLWARGQNTETSAPETAEQLIREGMQMINGERWAFIDNREEREGLWHKRRSYKVLECPVHGMLWKVTVFVRRGY